MRCALWPEGSETEHREEVTRFFAGQLQQPLQTLMAADPDGGILGFVELSIRSYAEDCVTDRVAYLEGWFDNDVSAAAHRALGFQETVQIRCFRKVLGP